jgi:hypothetical protein
MVKSNAPFNREDIEDTRDQRGIISEAIAQRIGKRQHPLAHRNSGKNPIDQAGRRFSHPPSAARIAEAASLTRIRNYSIQAACIAVQPNEASRQDAAVEELARLAFDEAGYRAIPLALPRQEGFQVPGNSRIEGTIFRLARTIGRIDSHAVSWKQAPWQLSGSAD